MQPQDYDVEPLYAVLLGAGRWAVCCEWCATTVATCDTRPDADAAIVAHRDHHDDVDQARGIARYLLDLLADNGTEPPEGLPEWIYLRAGYDHLAASAT